ncbi:hypothetical protein ACHQM5_029460 [Ranunculus cassubicifolius]
MEFDQYHAKQKPRLLFCLSCFRKHPPHEQLENHHSEPSSPRFIRSLSFGLKSRAEEKCRNLFCKSKRRTRRHSGDFRYDAMSYALNFDHGDEESDENDSYLRDFSSRLPHSPLGSPERMVGREITAFRHQFESDVKDIV